jgi:homocysteine S-methyltransferase
VLDAAHGRGEAWLERFKGFRANASSKSHAELDNSTSLDRGNPGELARRLAELSRAHGLRVVGGCCGTDAEHISAIGRALAGA